MKLIDFGMAKILEGQEQRLDTACGSPLYMAPEVLESATYDKRCDLWSVGVICFTLLAGEPPFYDDSAPKVFQRITTCDYGFDQEVWNFVSLDAKDFIEGLIEPDVDRRL